MTEQSKHVFEARHYNMLADVFTTVMHNTKEEHIDVAKSLFLRVALALAMKNSNMQIGRFMQAAGIPEDADRKVTMR